ncbi:agmatine deiminase [Pseudarcicella hirudinis]|uniref:Agmatine deiminase n=1 Tax=Pseudarcicella hirudinis TaxID=1079859 RepID=A0A1I5RLP1_9BACT|nr:agmatine deiminase family protein [Pseudarcicella hirudinis]SFP59474.1 agmatine deiminase [Pseudarcicella hirudinis]
MSNNNSNIATPKSQGFFFPPEWHPHAATWLTFPHNDASWQGDKLAKMYPQYFQLIKAISKGEKVGLNVNNETLKSFILNELPKYDIDFNQIEILVNPTNDAWCRDHGPAFLINPETKERMIVDWGYNAWGGKYPPFDDDNRLSSKIAAYRGLKTVTPGIIMEGGSVEFNGAGTILTSRECLLNENRNPHLTQAQIEQYLFDFYGAEQILWVNDGIVGDDTDGHIDDTVRFVNEDTVITMVEPDKADDNHEILEENLQLLKGMRLLNGKQLNIVEINMPEPVIIDDFRGPASYANFLICNAGVLVPTFQCKNDDLALDTLSQIFKDRPVIGLDSTDIIWGQGSFHCLSQQEPSV